MYMKSTSSAGSYSLTVTFEQGTDIDQASVKVQNRIAMADASLPSAVKQQGVTVAARSGDILLFVALETDRPELYDALYLSNYAQLNLVDDLARLPGVGSVDVFGAGNYSMRVWLDPARMRVRGISPQEVVSAIESQNMAVSSGAVGASPAPKGQAFDVTLTANGRLSSPQEFAAIVLRADSLGRVLRLGDVANVELGSESYGQTSRINGREAAALAVSQRSGANALEVSRQVKARLAELEEYFPQGVHARVVLDTTEFVDASIRDLLSTFVMTAAIVMMVIWLFLQNPRAVAIAMLVIPVSLVATFAVMKLMGFSLNTLSLFGLVLAIAIVVDDAIVVVEGCSRELERSSAPPREAVAGAMRSLQGPIVGEVLVLMSVFVPTAFISGITGQLYKQFALTIAVSTAFSGVMALTLTPAMCARFLRGRRRRSRCVAFRAFNALFERFSATFGAQAGRMLRRPALWVAVFAALLFGAFAGLRRLPTEYVPTEDMGYFMTSVQLPQGASLERTDSVMHRISQKVMEFPQVANVISIAGHSFMGGGDGSDGGSLFVVLRPWAQRRGPGESVAALIERTDSATASIEEAEIYSLAPPAIPGLGMTSGLEMQILDINSHGPVALAEAVAAMGETLRSDDSRFASVMSLYRGAVPQLALKVDRNKVKLMGLTMDEVYSTVSAFMGTDYAGDFVKFGRTYEVNLSGSPWARAAASRVAQLAVRSADGEMVSLGSVASVEPSMGESSVSRYNLYRSASLTATPRHGVSSSQGIALMEETAREALGREFGYAWTGEAYQQTQPGATVGWVMLFAMVVTLLVLAAQYESWRDAAAVLVTAPTALLGTVIGCTLMRQSVSVYTQIGIILLLGMAAKNAILIVEYATEFVRGGLDATSAALRAAQVRLRPIMMTALAFVFGVMPMMFATGAGAEARRELGTAVVWGMAVNALVGTLFVPLLWRLIRGRCGRSGGDGDQGSGGAGLSKADAAASE